MEKLLDLLGSRARHVKLPRVNHNYLLQSSQDCERNTSLLRLPIVRYINLFRMLKKLQTGGEVGDDGLEENHGDAKSLQPLGRRT